MTEDSETEEKMWSIVEDSCVSLENAIEILKSCAQKIRRMNNDDLRSLIDQESFDGDEEMTNIRDLS